MTLWTLQSEEVCRKIEEDGVVFSRRAYVQKKYAEAAPVFLTAYDFFAAAAPRYAPKPEGAEYPYWAFGDPRDLDLSGGGKVLQLRVPADQAVFFDMYDWYRVLNLEYMPESPEDAAEFAETLRLRGVRDMRDVMFRTFYPDLKQRMMSGWMRLFRFDSAVKRSAAGRANEADKGVEAAGDKLSASPDGQLSGNADGLLSASNDSKSLPFPLPEGMRSLQAGLWCIRREWVSG